MSIAFSTLPMAQNTLSQLQDHLRRAKIALKAARDRQIAYADKLRRELEFNEGQLVLLSKKNLSFKQKGSRKFLPKYVGPFKILKRVGHLAYRLELPPKLKKYEVGWAHI